ncbi:MAG: CDP-archaeol synthase [Verrucomicrobiota bacterium]
MSDPEPSASATPRAAKFSSFLRRFRSTLVLWLLIGSALASAHSVLFFLVIITLTGIGVWEYFRLLDLKEDEGDMWITLVLSLGYVSASFWWSASGRGTDWSHFDLLALYTITVAGFSLHIFSPVRKGDSHSAVMACVFGFVYVVLLFSFVSRISWFDDGYPHQGQVPGRAYLFFLLAVTKCTDMGAYIVGSFLGRRKMVPHLSPDKTWEGAAGAVLFSFLAAYIIRALLPGGIPLLTWFHTSILALLIAIGAVLGDLAESILKRSLQAKDSAKVIPGIGGVLDLIDSIIFTAPLLYFYLLWLHG